MRFVQSEETAQKKKANEGYMQATISSVQSRGVLFPPNTPDFLPTPNT